MPRMSGSTPVVVEIWTGRFDIFLSGTRANLRGTSRPMMNSVLHCRRWIFAQIRTIVIQNTGRISHGHWSTLHRAPYENVVRFRSKSRNISTYLLFLNSIELVVLCIAPFLFEQAMRRSLSVVWQLLLQQRIHYRSPSAWSSSFCEELCTRYLAMILLFIFILFISISISKLPGQR